MFGIPQDVLSQLFALFSFVVDPSRRLFATLLVYALVPIPVLVLLRRLSLVHSYRLTSLRFAFRRIWTTQRRRPKLATESAVRLVEDTRSNPLTAVLCWVAAVAVTLWWWFAVIDAFDTTSIRAGLGQRRPVMFGVPLSPDVRWSVDSDHLVLLVFALSFVLTPILLGRRFRMVHAGMDRSRGRAVPPWYADPRFVTGFSIGIVALIIADLMVWSRVAVLIAVAADVAVSAVLVRTVRLEAATEPDWVGRLAPPARSAGRPGSTDRPVKADRPRSLGLPWRPVDPPQGTSPAGTSASAAAPASPDVPTGTPAPAGVRGLFRRPVTGRPAILRGRPPTASPPTAVPLATVTPAATRAMPAGGGTAVLPTSDQWSSYAPPLAPLKPHDPRRIGSYALQGRLGVGGMSVVYAGRHRFERRDVAIKVMRDVLDDAEAQSRLLREMEALASATGPYTVKIVTVGHGDAGSGGVGHFLVMDRLFGPNLWDFVNRCGPVTDPGALTHLAVVLAAGLADFHARAVTHRDLKPANVMLTDGGPVIVDLGIAKLADVTATMPGSTGFATLGYVAPETILGRGTMATADVWSWGCCLAYAASGQRLFPGEEWDPVTYAILNGRRNPAAMDALRRISPPLADLVGEATEVDPGRRPFNGSALLTRLPAGTRWPTPSLALGSWTPTSPTMAR